MPPGMSATSHSHGVSATSPISAESSSSGSAPRRANGANTRPNKPFSIGFLFVAAPSRAARHDAWQQALSWHSPIKTSFRSATDKRRARAWLYVFGPVIVCLPMRKEDADGSRSSEIQGCGGAGGAGFSRSRCDGGQDHRPDRAGRRTERQADRVSRDLHSRISVADLAWSSGLGDRARLRAALFRQLIVLREPAGRKNSESREARQAD